MAILNENLDKTLGTHRSTAGEALLVSIAIVQLLVFVVCVVLIPKTSLILILPAITCLVIFLIFLTYTGGLRYEADNSKLLIKSGLLNIKIGTIELTSATQIQITDYKVLKSVACGWQNLFPDNVTGYVRGFRGKALLLFCNNQKYLIATENPEELKANIEKHIADHV